MITHEDLLAALNYDPLTGVFTWRSPGRRRVVGRTVGSWDMHGYLTVRLAKRSYKLHRLAWFYVTGSWPKNDIDHINGVRHDNRYSNLRDVPRKTNLENRATIVGLPTKTGLMGAYYDKRRNNYYARISHGNKNINLGCYETALEAHQSYLKAKSEIHAGFVAK